MVLVACPEGLKHSGQLLLVSTGQGDLQLIRAAAPGTGQHNALHNDRHVSRPSPTHHHLLSQSRNPCMMARCNDHSAHTDQLRCRVGPCNIGWRGCLLQAAAMRTRWRPQPRCPRSSGRRSAWQQLRSRVQVWACWPIYSTLLMLAKLLLHGDCQSAHTTSKGPRFCHPPATMLCIRTYNDVVGAVTGRPDSAPAPMS
jgi:hypothetical protein